MTTETSSHLAKMRAYAEPLRSERTAQGILALTADQGHSLRGVLAEGLAAITLAILEAGGKP